MRKNPFFRVCMLMLLLTALLCGGALADDAGGEDADTPQAETALPSPSPTPQPTAAPVVNHDFAFDVEMGYEGLVILNRWTPVFVTVTNQGSDFDGMLGVNVFYGPTEYDRYEIPLTLAAGATKRVQLAIVPQMRQDMYAFELVKGGAIVAETRVAPKRLAAPETVTIGVLSDTPQNLSYMNQRAGSADTMRGEVWLTIPLTADNFPETADLLDAYAMLAIDGMDVRTLRPEQQEALSAWLLKGGFVIVSGGAKAASGYPFFSQWTLLSAEGLAEYGDISGALATFAATNNTTSGDAAIWLNALPAAGATITTEDGAQGLLAAARAGDGLIFSAAFDLGGKPQSTWPFMTGFWPRVLRQAAPAQYLALLNRLDNMRYGGGQDGYYARTLVDSLRVPNTESSLPPLLLLLAYVLLVSVGGYLLLKKIDRREWLWVLVPCAALVFALGLFALSRGTTMNDPVALTAARVTIEGEDAQVITYVGIATPDGGEMTIGSDQNKLPSVLSSDGGYYFYDDGMSDNLYRPVNMRQRFRLGDDPAIGFVSSEAWETKMLQMTSLERDIGALDVTMWMEEDGMHGEVANQTEHAIYDAFAVTSFGYSEIGDILPGQTVAFAMRYPKTPIDVSQTDFKIEPNVLYSTLDIDTTGQSYYYFNLYTFLERAVYKGKNYSTIGEAERQRMAMVQMYESEWSLHQASGAYYFIGFNDTVGQTTISLNDVPVTRTAHTAVLGSRITFAPIGPTGQVMFPQGAIAPEVVQDMGDDAKPNPVAPEEDTTNGNYYGNNSYITLSGPTAVRFVLPEHDAYTIERMTVAGSYYDSLPTMFLYNNDTGAWDQQLLLSLSMTGAEWAPYIDEEGGIYLRYVPKEGGSRYEGMELPTIALKGEVK